MSKLTFSIGFWHPFGPHSDESPNGILKRKVEEIDKNSWTLWSFQHRLMLDVWHQELTKANPEKVLVFCSSGGGRDPQEQRSGVPIPDCCRYREIGQTGWQEWQPIKNFCVPHSFRSGKKMCASAFIVKRIISPVERDEGDPGVEWFKKDGTWQQNRIPTRGEYLIRSAPGGVQIRRIQAILELQSPYLAEVSADL